MADVAIDLDLSQAAAEEMSNFSYTGEALETSGTGRVVFNFDVPEAALYELEIDYYPLKGSGTAIERSIRINGEVPFDEANRVLFERIFKDSNKDYKTVEGNQSFPSQVEATRWNTVRVRDQNRYFTEPLKFYLAAGSNSFSLDSIKEPMAIRSIRFVPAANVPSYAEYISGHEAAGAKVIEESEIATIQGEDATSKSQPSLYPLNDRTSPLTRPYHPSYIRMNTIGGQSWSRAGDWLEWEVDVKTAGLYRFTMRNKQDLNTGIHSTRKLYVNGELPFAEANQLRFAYNTTWQRFELADEEGNSQLIYLDEGKNTLRLEVSLDVFSELIYEVEDIAVN